MTEQPATARHERLISTQCRVCGESIAYTGTGRRPRFCSPACRQRAWALRRAAEQLDRPDPLPTTVREVVERTTEVERTVPATPATVADWVAQLAQLEHKLRENPHQLAQSERDFRELAAAVRALHAALEPRATEDRPAAPEGLSRQQRRALERQRRKR